MAEVKWGATMTYRRGVQVIDGSWLNPDHVAAVRVEETSSGSFEVAVYIDGEGFYISEREDRTAAQAEADQVAQALWGDA